MDAGNMLKPALARGELHMIGATTLDEYRKNIEKDPALERRFQPVLVREPTVEETIEILTGLQGPLRGVPSRADHRRGDRRRGGAVRPLHPRPLPARQGDRPDRPGGRAGPAAVEDEGRRTRGQLEEELRRLGRERDQAIAAEDYERADELKDADRRAPRRSWTRRKEAAPRAPEVTPEDIAEIVSRAHRHPGLAADRRRSATGS